MESFLNSLSRTVSHHWETATPNDFGALALAIVTSCWFFCRYVDR